MILHANDDLFMSWLSYTSFNQGMSIYFIYILSHSLFSIFLSEEKKEGKEIEKDVIENILKQLHKG